MYFSGPRVLRVASGPRVKLASCKRANLSAFRTFVRFVPFWFCRFPLPIGVWEGLRFVIVVFPGLFSYPLLVRVAISVTEARYAKTYCAGGVGL